MIESGHAQADGYLFSGKELNLSTHKLIDSAYNFNFPILLELIQGGAVLTDIGQRHLDVGAGNGIDKVIVVSRTLTCVCRFSNCRFNPDFS